MTDEVMTDERLLMIESRIICTAVASVLSPASPLSTPSAGQTRSAQLQLPDAPELVLDRSGAFLRVRFSKVTLREADAHLLEPYNWPEPELHAAQSAPGSAQKQQAQARSSHSRPAAAAQRTDAAAHVRASRARASADDALPPAMAARAAAASDDDDDDDDAIDECYLQVRSGQPLESSRWQYMEKSVLLIAHNHSTRVLPLPVALSAHGSRFPSLTRCIRHQA